MIKKDAEKVSKGIALHDFTSKTAFTGAYITLIQFVMTNLCKDKTMNSYPQNKSKPIVPDEELNAAEIDLSSGDLNEIENSFSKITMHDLLIFDEHMPLINHWGKTWISRT